MTILKKILIVDDEVHITETFKKILSKKMDGFEIHTANDGQEAYEKVQNIEYTFIITDINMPNLSGDKFIEKILENNITHGYIYIMSGYFENEDKFKNLCQEYFSKPTGVSDLISLMQRKTSLAWEKLTSESK